MTVVLITGMSGAGKSTVLDRLAGRGYRTVDTDVGDWIENGPNGPDTEPQWRADQMDALLAEHQRSGEPLFIAGTVWNQGRFYDRVDVVVLLSAPLPVLLERVAVRDTNPFGRTAEERARIVADTRHVEPLLRSSAGVEIDTRAPIGDVADRLEALAGAAAT